MLAVVLFWLTLWAAPSFASELESSDAVADASTSDISGAALQTIRVGAVQAPNPAPQARPDASQWRRDSSGCNMRFKGPAEVVAVPSRTLDAHGQVRCIWYVHHTRAEHMSLHFQALQPGVNAFQDIRVQQADGSPVGPRWVTPMASATAGHLPRTVIISITPSNARTAAGLDIIAY